MNSETMLTLEDAVGEVLGLLTGLDLTYDPELDRFRAITRQLNRSMRAIALEQEWGYFSSVQTVDTARCGEQEVRMRSSLRPRIINDDAVRLVDEHDHPVAWAYFLPRDALHKYIRREGLWVSVTRNSLLFSRPFNSAEDGLGIQLPVMREPAMFRLPPAPESSESGIASVSRDVLDQPIDFNYPDLVILRAAYYYAQSDPVMQPRVQTLEAQYKDMMYQVMERDSRNTDSPYQNDFFVPVQASIGGLGASPHGHPHADERRL